MSKVFGYPEFDATGEKILTTYENEYKDMNMDIRVYQMKAGDKKTFLKPEEETAVLLLNREHGPHASMTCPGRNIALAVDFGKVMDLSKVTSVNYHIWMV